MSYWSDLVGKAKGYAWDRKPKRVMNSIERGRMDEMVYSDLVKDVPALASVAYDLNEQHAFTGELVQDTFHAFYKGEPELVPTDSVDARALINRAVMEQVLSFPDTAATQEMTKHDLYGAALATVGLEETLDRELTRSEKAKEVQEASEEAAKAEAELRDAEAAAQQAQDALEQATGDQTMGPLTPQQQQLVDDLESALQQVSDQGDKVVESRQQTQQAVDNLARQVRGKAHESVQNTLKQLEEEQELFHAFGYEPGVISRMSFPERQALVKMLANSKIGKWRKLIGRFRMRASAERAHKVQYGRDEVYDIEMSNRLPDVMPFEFGLLVNRHTRLMFLQRFATGQLLSRAWRGKEPVGDGAVITIGDTSSSMRETDVGNIQREAWMKAVSLSMLDQAHAAKRDFVSILFASAHQQRMWTFPANEPIDPAKLIEWGEFMFNGGTNFDRPIDMAMDVLEAEYNTAGKQRGDLVILTDDDCSVTTDWMKTYQERKKRLDFRTFGVSIGSEPGITLAALCDNVRSIQEFANPDPGELADLHRTI